MYKYDEYINIYVTVQMKCDKKMADFYQRKKISIQKPVNKKHNNVYKIR